jgi:hypothetical protein
MDTPPPGVYGRSVTLLRTAFDSIGAHPRCTHTANAVADARLLTVVEAAGG